MNYRKYEIHQVGQVFDSTTCRDEQNAIIGHIENKHSIVLDLSRCTYLSSAGLRVMLFAYKTVKIEGLDICLPGLNTRVVGKNAVLIKISFFISGR